MKKILPLLLLSCAMQTQAQVHTLVDEGRFHIGANFKYGWLKDRMNPMPAPGVYPQTVNYRRTPINRDFDNAYGADAQIGYFFSPDSKWGLGIGFSYLKGSGFISIDSLHYEYRSVDSKGDVFRQVITNTAPITEELEITNMAIPLVVKYRTAISDRFRFNIDGGIVYNVKMKTEYSGTAAYNYEAIYRFDMSSGTPVAVYDNNPQPLADDWLITVQEYNEDKTDGNVNDYFNTLQSQGFNVGLDEAAAKSGTIEHTKGTIGILLQPSFGYKLTDVISLNLGGYFMYQKFKNEDSRSSRMTDKIGEYNSMLHNMPRRRQYNTGFNIGLSLSL